MSLCFFSAYHGHLTSLIDISHYKFSLPGGPPQKEYVHVVSTFIKLLIRIRILIKLIK